MEGNSNQNQVTNNNGQGVNTQSDVNNQSVSNNTVVNKPVQNTTPSNIPTNELQSIADNSRVNSNYKPNINLGNAPVVEQPKVEKVNEPVPGVTQNTNTSQNVNVTPAPKTNDNSKVIGTLKPDKQKSPMLMLILFLLLIGFIMFMDPVIEFVNDKFGIDIPVGDGLDIVETKEPVATDPTTNTDNKENNKNNNENLKVYDYSETLNITVDKLLLSDFKKINNNNIYNISFNVTNTTSTNYNFSKKLYIDFYNSNGSFIDRILINTDSIPANGKVIIASDISKDVYDNGVKVEALFRSNDDYPTYTLINNTLTCKKNTNTIIFNFEKEKLVSINDTIEVSKTNNASEYTTQLMNNKISISNLDAVDGVTAVLTENDNGYITSIAIDYTVALYESLPKNDKYYKKDTMPGVIKFELEAKGYTCS